MDRLAAPGCDGRSVYQHKKDRVTETDPQRKEKGGEGAPAGSPPPLAARPVLLSPPYGEVPRRGGRPCTETASRVNIQDAAARGGTDVPDWRDPRLLLECFLMNLGGEFTDTQPGRREEQTRQQVATAECVCAHNVLQTKIKGRESNFCGTHLRRILKNDTKLFPVVLMWSFGKWQIFSSGVFSPRLSTECLSLCLLCSHVTVAQQLHTRETLKVTCCLRLWGHRSFRFTERELKQRVRVRASP